ncbi:hypothetical protein QO206_13285 [Leeuwenhoekiella aequorea]|tara:strand:+ start:19528 stop:19677 length:150 start_codon:yes stop_codon:yes gene_type:complete
MKYEVIAKKWGKYSKGDVIDGMHASTAKGPLNAKRIKEVSKPEAKSKNK